MPDQRTIEAATEYSVFRFKRAIEMITAFLSEASVLVLVFGLLDMYSTNKLTWNVGEVVAGSAAVLFAIDRANARRAS
jgi:Zn-dependent membrane protease YugP